MTKTIKIGPYVMSLDIDADVITKDYQTWLTKVKQTGGRDIGISGEKTLFQFIEKQGIVGRVVFDKESPEGRETEKKSGSGGSIFIPLLDNFFKQAEFRPDDFKQLEQIYSTLKSNSEANSPMNPRNMSFNGIKNYSRKPMTGKNGKVLLDAKGNPRHKVINERIFGHYRNEMYVEYRKKIKKIEEFDGHESWSGTESEKGTIMPPMWQALYAKKEGNLKIKKSLIQIVENALKVLKNAKGRISAKTPIQIKGQGTADAVYRGLSDVKEFIDKAVANSSYQTRAGNFRTKLVTKWLSENPIKIDETSEDKLIKNIMETITANYPIKITEVYLKVSPLMIKRMAGLAGFQPPVKKDKEVKKMSWQEVLVR
tara:strand:+ start:6619 stop:7725 length:1107 start_codon:yes stop_codon:yes gene_type:complete